MYTISIKDLNDICRSICLKLTPSGSSCLDRETFYYAVYWQLCDAVDQCISVGALTVSRTAAFRNDIREFAGLRHLDSSTVLSLTDSIIEATIRSNYPITAPPEYDQNKQIAEMGEIFSGRAAVQK